MREQERYVTSKLYTVKFNDVRMSVSLQFTCPTRDEATRKAMESYVGYLERVFEQYWNLWEDYVNLKEKHKQCNVNSSLQVLIDKPFIEVSKELTPQKRQDNSILTQEHVNVSLLKLDTLHTDSYTFDPKNSENLNKDIKDISSPKSPVFSSTLLQIGNNSVKKITQFKAVSVCSNSSSNTKMHYNFEKVPTKCGERLEISTSQHVETTFLPDGKKLKQSRLVFHPVKHEEKKISRINKLKLVDKNQENKQYLTNDTSLVKTFDIIENSTIVDCDEDVIEISPTQRDIHSNIKSRLSLKRKNLAKQLVKSSLNKSKSQIPGFSSMTEMTTKNTNYELCPSHEYTSLQAMCKEPLVKSFDVVNTLEDNNKNNSTLIQKYSEANVKITECIDDQKKGNASNLKEEETFYLPVEQTTKKDYTDYLSVYDLENKPPMKRMLLDKSNVFLREKDDSEQLNLRCKADRAKVNGLDCWMCEKYYKNLSLSKEELQKRMNQCSRHRHKYKRPNTPEDFWNPEFPETPTFIYSPNKK